MKTNDPLVSVVIPSYNEGTYIGRLLEALSHQTADNFEVIVSDAQSKDETAEVVKSFHQKLDVQLVSSPPKGPAIGRNIGAVKARGQWLLFLDADVDIDDPNFISTLVATAEIKNWQTASSNIRVRHPSFGDRLGMWLHRRYLKMLSHTKHPVAPGFCILTKRELFEANHGFDAKLWVAEDYDYVSRVSRHGFGFVGATYYYVDLRRFNEGGKLKVFWQSIYYEYYRLTHGFKIEKDPKNYQFGSHKDLK